MNMDGGPLAGTRVIEISSFVAAPLGGMTLAQLGAEVIRIDPLGGAPDTSRWPLAADGTSMYWAGLNKGKKSAEIDTRSAAGQDLVRQLVATSPRGSVVVLTNVVGRDWLSYEALKTVAPDLIHVQVEGNPDGTPAVDYTVNAEVGFPMITGPAGMSDPVNHVLPAWDIACGLYAALGVTAAVRKRDRTGAGGQVRVALSDVALATAGNLGFLAEAQVNEVERTRIGNYLYGGFARDFACVDGRVMVVALTARHWRDLLGLTAMEASAGALEQALGVDFTVEDDRFRFREALAALFQPWFAERTTAQVSQSLEATSLVWAPYRSFKDVVTTLQASHGGRALMSRIDQPGVGLHWAPGLPLFFDNHGTGAVPAPRLGADTHEVLASIPDLTDAAIDRLAEAGTIADSHRTPTRHAR